MCHVVQMRFGTATELGSLKRGREAIVEGTTLVAIAVEGPELKESQKKVET